MTANQKFSRFIGIDVSKAKLDIYDDATGEFLTVENTAKAIEKYVSALSPDPELLIVVDLTGGYEALCVNTFYNRGFTVHRAEGRRVKAFMRSYGEHAKTDRIDAYALALFGRKLHETLRMYTPLPLNLKPVTERISDLKTMLLQEKNRSTAPSLPPDMKKKSSDTSPIWKRKSNACTRNASTSSKTTRRSPKLSTKSSPSKVLPKNLPFSC